MKTTRTEPRIKKERVAVYVSLGLAFAAIAAIVPMMPTTAFAEQPSDANCWGDVTTEFAQEDDGSPGIGEHASDTPTVEDDKPGRVGLPNIPIDEDTPNHPSEVGEVVGTCE